MLKNVKSTRVSQQFPKNITLSIHLDQKDCSSINNTLQPKYNTTYLLITFGYTLSYSFDFNDARELKQLIDI